MAVDKELEEMIKERDRLSEDFKEKTKKLRSEIEDLSRFFEERLSVLKIMISRWCG